MIVSIVGILGSLFYFIIAIILILGTKNVRHRLKLFLKFHVNLKYFSEKPKASPARSHFLWHLFDLCHHWAVQLQHFCRFQRGLLHLRAADHILDLQTVPGIRRQAKRNAQ